MSRIILAVPALALAVFLSGSAQATDGVPSDSTLKAMGLAGIQVMSDGDAMAIRGKGYEPSDRKKGYGSWAWGRSWASVGEGGTTGGSGNTVHNGNNGGGNNGGNAGAGTKDHFKSHGRYKAGGDHYSEAKIVTTDSTTIGGKRFGITTTKVHSVYVYAGGGASAYSF